MTPVQYNSSIRGLGFFAGTFWRMHHFAKAGDQHQGHKHIIDHTTLISQGGVRCDADGEVTEHWAPAVIEIAKGVKHQFTALADNTVYFCVFATEHFPDTLHNIDDAKQALCGDCQGCRS